MSNAPKKIYLHDPFGFFDDEHGGDNTVLWSEDMIDVDDIEYIRADDDVLPEEVAPRKSGVISNLGFLFHCGNCNSTNIKLVINDKGDYKHFQYCPDCGKKVDWRNFR